MNRLIAYFSMEIALEPAIPTYAGGLGILAGDTIRSAADAKVPILAVSLLHRKGYLNQRLDPSGWQREEPVEWRVEDFLQELPARVQVHIQGRVVHLRAWQYEVKAPGGFIAPVLLLDTDLPENSEWDRTLTHYLYGGEQLYRLCQEVILGIGGVRMLRALGFQNLTRFHMNEGHASLLTLELLQEEVKRAGRTTITHDDILAVRKMCIFTTHTPVSAGHDQFPMELVSRVMGAREDLVDLHDTQCVDVIRHVLGTPHNADDPIKLFNGNGVLNMTHLALNLSHYVNGVAKKHGEISRQLFAGYEIDAITNGVHVATWTAESFQKLFDRYIPGWRQDNFSLRYAHSIPVSELWEAHLAAKRLLIAHVNHLTSAAMDEETLTLGFARRATLYKRSALLVRDVPRLKTIAAQAGKLQIIYAGKAHPNDHQGKEMIQHIIQIRDSLGPDIKLVYLENYDFAQARLLTSGVDVWLNTPQPPLEASGTSGMKAALNGVPSLSVLDGWWIEGCLESQTGWAIGDHDTTCDPADRSADDAASLYDKLERIVIPMFYHERSRYLDMMRHCISLNGSFFNTQRMIQQYVLKAYFE